MNLQLGWRTLCNCATPALCRTKAFFKPTVPGSPKSCLLHAFHFFTRSTTQQEFVLPYYWNYKSRNFAVNVIVHILGGNLGASPSGFCQAFFRYLKRCNYVDLIMIFSKAINEVQKL